MTEARGADAPASPSAEAGTRKTVRARHAASVIVLRGCADNPEMLMGMRGAGHRFMPNRLVFPGGSVERADMSAPCASPLSPRTEWALRKSANPSLTHGLGIAASRELLEETGLTLGTPPRLDGLSYLMRAVTPIAQPIRFNARFFVINEQEVGGTLGGDGELENLRFYGMREALALDLATPTRRVVDQLQAWLAMSEAERLAVTHTFVLRSRPPRAWME